MTIIVAARAGDSILLRLPGAAWRALPLLTLCGAAAAGLVALAAWAGVIAPPLVPVLAAAAASPLIAVGMDAVHRQLFVELTPVSRARRMLASALACTIPALLACWSVVVAGIADAAGSWPLQVLAVAAVAAAVICAAVAVVALPLALWRADASLRSIALLCLLAAIQHPLGSLAALASAAAVVWLGLTWFAGLLILVVPVLVVLSIGASWTTAAAAGVRIPRLSPMRSRHPSSTGEEA